MPAGEDRLLRWLRDQLDEPLIGDDAAVLPAGGPFAVTVDHQIAGVHFPPGLDAAVIARRLLAVNLSDLAATGAVPAYAFLALAAPAGFDHKKFFMAFLAGCRRFGLRLAGGDLARSDRFTAALTLMGTKEKGGRWLTRGGAAPGHALWLGGTVGESAAGRLVIERGEEAFKAFSSALRAAARRAARRHLHPEPQIDLGRWLAKRKEGAAMDVSDGVARDLHRLCRASGTGAEIEAEALPLSDRFTDLCETLDADPLTLALGGGEDYVLLFTLPRGEEPPEPFACRRIGTITKRRGVWLLRDSGKEPLPELGWDHLG
ncbi:MAG TPA: thiamine-phosphate kinase [Thermoanaerobaculia bacterium]